MELSSLEMVGKTLISIIVAWAVYMAVTKWVWTLMKWDQNPAQDDNEACLPTSSAELCPLPGQKHDVFLTFRGVDTRRGITTEIYLELQKKGVKVFMDNQDLVKGSSISLSLLKAIEESRFAVVVLSQNYASSPWCLDELTNIVQCMENEDRILPLFYDVEPCDIRHLNKSYEVAFKEHEEKSRHNTEKLNEWRDALKKVANLSGWDSKNFGSDRELVKDIVESICNRLRPIESECSMSKGDFKAFGVTRQAIDMVMKALKDDDVTGIGVYGTGGVGKTTLVNHVGEQACKIGIFHHVIKAVVSQNPDLRKIQGTLADLLGVKFQEETETGRAGRLHKEILRRNNLLIVLDDIWKILDLSTIGIPSYDKLKTCKSKVLLTTRRLQVCHSMECQTSISLNFFLEEDSWSLFVKKTKKSFEKSPKFYGIACFGLLIALIVIARALGDKDLVEWERASQRLNKSQFANPEDEGDAFECMKLSYDYLKDKDFKSCFMLCFLVPEDYDIQVEDLFNYRFGKRLFRDGDTIKEARGTTKSIVIYLKSSSLLMDSEEDGCGHMHDAIWDTAIQIARDEFLGRARHDLMEWPRGLHVCYFTVSLSWNNIDHLAKQLVELEDCPFIQRITEASNKIILPKLKKITLKRLPELFYKSGTLEFECPSLEHCWVMDCSKYSCSVNSRSSKAVRDMIMHKVSHFTEDAEQATDCEDLVDDNDCYSDGEDLTDDDDLLNDDGCYCDGGEEDAVELGISHDSEPPNSNTNRS